MPLSAHEQRTLAAIDDELSRHDPQLYALFTRCSPPLAPGPRTARGARRTAVPVAIAVWAVVVALVAVSAVGLVNSALIVLALGLVISAHVARYLARRTLYRRFEPAALPQQRHRSD